MIRSLLATLLLAAGLAAFAADPVKVRLIGIHDFHGNLESTNLSLMLSDPADPARAVSVPTGGAAALKATVRALRAGAKHSILVGAGDMVGAAPPPSSMFFHESTVEALNEIGIDLTSVGNHEFDAGVPELRRLIHGGCAGADPKNPAVSCALWPYRGARFTYLAANVVDAHGKTLAAPFAIRYYEGVPIGFIGAGLKSTPQMVTGSGLSGWKFLDEADAANRAADQLRARGVKTMVLLVHQGVDITGGAKHVDWNDTTCPGAHGPLFDIARRLAPEIRIVFGGHVHTPARCEVDGRLLIQGSSFGRGVAVVDVDLDRGTKQVVAVRSQNIPVLNERTPAELRAKLADAAPEALRPVLRDTRPDAAMAAKVARYSDLVREKVERPVGRIGGRFDRTSDGADASAGRLVADAQLEATRRLGAQLALMNIGGIRTNLECGDPPCTVTFGQVFTMQPFGNSLVVMTLTGEQIKTALESQQRGASGEPRFMQPSEGFTYTWDSNAPAGSRVRDMRLAGEPLDPAKTYRVTVNSFMAEGGEGFDGIREGTDRVGGGQDIDAMLAYLGAGERSPTPARITRIAKEKSP